MIKVCLIKLIKLPFFFSKNGPIPASFCLFSFFSCYNFNTNWKKHRLCAWDSNPGPQDGRRRQNHGVMAATHKLPFLLWPDVLKLLAITIPETFLPSIAIVNLIAIMPWLRQLDICHRQSDHIWRNFVTMAKYEGSYRILQNLLLTFVKIFHATGHIFIVVSGKIMSKLSSHLVTYR